MKNWWGEEAHPSDCLVHWSERRDSKEFKERRKKLIIAWDVIQSNPKIAAAYETLAKWERNFAGSEQAEADAGEDL